MDSKEQYDEIRHLIARNVKAPTEWVTTLLELIPDFGNASWQEGHDYAIEDMQGTLRRMRMGSEKENG
jgi:hypothetical protein